jgi:hypothetical protein
MRVEKQEGGGGGGGASIHKDLVRGRGRLKISKIAVRLGDWCYFFSGQRFSSSSFKGKPFVLHPAVFHPLTYFRHIKSPKPRSVIFESTENARQVRQPPQSNKIQTLPACLSRCSVHPTTTKTTVTTHTGSTSILARRNSSPPTIPPTMMRMTLYLVTARMKVRVQDEIRAEGPRNDVK